MIDNEYRIYNFTVETNQGKLKYFCKVNENELKQECDEYVDKIIKRTEKKIEESGLHLSDKDKKMILDLERKKAEKLFITRKRDYFDEQAITQSKRPEFYNFKNQQVSLRNEYLVNKIKNKEITVAEFLKYKAKTAVKSIKKAFSKIKSGISKTIDFIKSLKDKSNERSREYGLEVGKNFKVAGKYDLYDKVRNQQFLHDELKDSILLGKTKNNYEYTM